MKIETLLAGLLIFKEKMVDPHWNISQGGETIVVWDEGNMKDYSDLVVGNDWSYDTDDGGWIIASPIYA